MIPKHYKNYKENNYKLTTGTGFKGYIECDYKITKLTIYNSVGQQVLQKNHPENVILETR